MKPSFDTDIADALDTAKQILAAEYPDIRFRITVINDEAINHWRENWYRGWDRKSHTWDEVVQAIDENPLTIAVYADNQLYGLAAGQILSQEELRLSSIESRLNDNPLKGKIASIIIGIIETIALQKGVKKIVIDNVSSENNISLEKVEKVFRDLKYSRGKDGTLQKVLEEPHIPKHSTLKDTFYRIRKRAKLRRPSPP